ncbi:spore germination protein [Caldicellulosiruptor saccharolyticus DSM 8903]|uniref:Spore germination protein n=1 Tax=Caldicellulosiruptor saccharolyticus (strain ATCC 43494 / DSM 8903 / Tp8T 6331) TaxID=351627 RepID=A4XI76_CALS8|nr:endospore germination permease [Caldicellulosiruptor saccharolyticus]ABP66611.1 spore germination protein [Caldicellulosiruptor saccharolyticus DSM 8903]
MIVNDNDKISSFQCFVLFVSAMIGIGIMFMPSGVAKYADQNGWIVVLLGGIISFLVFMLLFKIAMSNPDVTFIELLDSAFGKVLGIVFSFIYVIYFVVFSSFETRLIAETAKEFLFNLTPTEVLIITFLLTCGYISRYGVEVIARMCEILMPGIIVIIIVLSFFVYQRLDFSNLLPILNIPIKKLIQGIGSTIFSFLGFEVFLFFLPYIRRKDKLIKSAFFGFSVTILVYEVIIIFCTADFGSKEMQTMVWPTLNLFRDVTVLEIVIERPESIVVALWMITTYTTEIIFLMVASLILARIFNTKEHNFFVFAQLPFIYILSLIPQNVLETQKYMDFFSYFFATFAVLILPLITYIVLVFKKKVKKT